MASARPPTDICAKSFEAAAAYLHLVAAATGGEAESNPGSIIEHDCAFFSGPHRLDHERLTTKLKFSLVQITSLMHDEQYACCYVTSGLRLKYAKSRFVAETHVIGLPVQPQCYPSS